MGWESYSMRSAGIALRPSSKDVILQGHIWKSSFAVALHGAMDNGRTYPLPPLHSNRLRATVSSHPEGIYPK